jgi:hypothetical protein
LLKFAINTFPSFNFPYYNVFYTLKKKKLYLKLFATKKNFFSSKRGFFGHFWAAHWAAQAVQPSVQPKTD